MIRSVAIIGAGIGREHVNGFLAVPDRFRIAAICDLDAERAAPLVEAAGAVYEPDLSKLLADPAIDMIDVCLPPHLHMKVASDALAAGKHVICEKPLVSSVAEADLLSERAATAGRQVFPVFQYRFGKGATEMRALIDAGLAGKPFVGTLETHWNRGADYYAIDWRGTWAGEQGGAILGHAIHIHDWLSFIFGPVAQVYADVGTRVNEIEVEDCAALSIRMESGALVTSSVTLGAADDTSRLRFAFEGLTAESGLNPYKPAEDTWTFTARAPFDQGPIDAALDEIGDPPSGYTGLFTAIADALDGDAGRAVTLADGRRSLEFVSAVYHSARTGAPVALPLTPDHPTYGGWTP